MAIKKNMTLRKSKRNRIDGIDIFAHAFNLIWSLLILYPVLNVLARSFSGNYAILANKVTIFPVDFTLQSYAYVFENPRIIRSFGNALLYTAVGVTCNLAATVLMAYPLSKTKLIGRSFIMRAMIFTLYFNGGMIPTYMLVSKLGMLDSMWSLIIPNIIYTNNCIIMINGFRATPESLYEAAYLDGAGDFQVFIRIALPLAKATIASLGLFYFMGHWNDFFTPMLYLNTSDKMPLQVVLRNMLIEEEAIGRDPGAVSLTPEGIKGAIIFITMVPVMIIYPFVQRFFVGGVMIGSVKG
ncbi:MAG: carbohydrate ABC transporter permease [Ruminococcaceae bacterium]|nr:carbohydrate ABC transporter permease [Oscillospiraceae bacterium]